MSDIQTHEFSGQYATLSVLRELLDERRKHEQKGFDAAHDDQHTRRELAHAAACYATSAEECELYWYIEGAKGTMSFQPAWPQHWSDNRELNFDGGYRHDLIVAASLLIAEIERIDRIPAKQQKERDEIEESF